MEAPGGELSNFVEADVLVAAAMPVCGSSATTACEAELEVLVSSCGVCAREAWQQVAPVGAFDCSSVVSDFGQHPCASADC